MENTKIFCGNAKIVPTKYGEMIKISFSKKDLETMLANLNNGWINTVLKEKKEKIEGKPTHYLEVDNWVSTPAGGATNTPEHKARLTKEDFNDMPF